MALEIALLLWCFQFCLASSGIRTGKAADFYVPHLPGLAPGTQMPEMHAGLLEVGSKLGLEEASLFFWHIRATQDTGTTVIWLNGGPGCSSMDGNLLEIGPFRVGDPDLGQSPNLLYNSKGTWGEVTNLLFVDQPFGTGYSDPGDNIFLHSVEDAAKAFTVFLKEYVKVFPEIAQTNIVLAGESFAGQYIPHIWHALRQDTDTWKEINGIQSVLLGNPWIDPPNQYLSVPQFIKDRALIPEADYAKLDSLQESCIEELQNISDKTGQIGFKVKSCELINDFVLERSLNSNPKKCFNIYKIDLESPYPQCGLEWPAGLDSVGDWLSREDVRSALHAPPKKNDKEKWVECSSQVHTKIATGENAKDFVSEILKMAPMMLMVGDNDYICNPLGQDRFVANLEWNGGVGFTENSAVEEISYGTWRSERNLTVVHVTNASHMLPVDDLELSRELFSRFTGIDSELDNYAPSRNHSLDYGSQPSHSGEEEINEAVYQAYRKAGMAALIVVLIVCAILGLIWWHRGQGISLKGLGHAMLQSSMRIAPKKKQHEYVPLHSMKHGRRSRRPEVIIEENEEDLEEP